MSDFSNENRGRCRVHRVPVALDDGCYRCQEDKERKAQREAEFAAEDADREMGIDRSWKD